MKYLLQYVRTCNEKGYVVMNNDVKGISIDSLSNSINISKVNKFIYLFIKRLFDIILSLFGILFLIPIAIVIKISYILNKDYSSIFYSQIRIGKNGKEFKLYKFRSMIPNADEVLKELMDTNTNIFNEYSKNKKLKDDPRVTKVGKFIRKTSLDEFPQFINVFKGDMSIVGNRPYLPREKKDMGNYYNDIVKTKCGIVSYWAIHGRSDVSFERRLELEKYYSNHQSLGLDAKIFIKSFSVVLLKKGAE